MNIFSSPWYVRTNISDNLTFVTVHTVTVMTFAVTLALPVTMGTIVRANLNLACFTGPYGIARAHTIDANPVTGTVDM